MKLTSSPKSFNRYKSRSPQETLAFIKKGFSNLSLHTIYNKRKVHSHEACLFSGDLKLLEINFSTTGKGISEILAEASAYAEMVERLSTGFFYVIDYNPADFYEKSMRILRREYLRGFNTGYSENVTFKEAQSFVEYLNPQQYDFLKENGLMEIGVEAYDPLLNEYTQVPVSLIDFIAGSNGLASGNSFEEAITQASCEAFERYAVSQVLTRKNICPTIDGESIKNEKIKKYLKLFEKLNIEVILKDLTLGGRVPVVGAFFINHNFDEDENPIKKIFFHKMLDAGSSLNLDEAIIRSLTERVQESTNESLMKYREMDRMYTIWNKSLNMNVENGEEDFRFLSRHYICRMDLTFLEKGEEIKFSELNSEANEDFLDDCKRIFKICEGNNWDVNIIDFTHKTFQFPTVRVVIKPISTSYDPFVRRLVNIVDEKKRFDFFYGIDGFYEYVHRDDWLDDRYMIKNLIEKIERYLTFNLPFYQINIARGLFYQPVNLFQILERLYAKLGESKKSKAYSLLGRSSDKTRSTNKTSPEEGIRRNPFKPRPYSREEKVKKGKILERLFASFF